MWLLLERIYDVQNKLQKTVVSDEFKEWLEGEMTTSQQEAKAIQRLCLKEEFSQEVKGLVIAILPLYKVLRRIDMEGSTIGLLHHFMEEASKEIEACTLLDGPIDGSRDVLENTPKRDDIVYLVKKRWEWMRRPIHGFAALLHPAYKKPSLFSDQVLNEERMKYLPKVLKEELHGEFLQEVINYGDQRGTAFASSVCGQRESLVKPIFWWESFGYQMPHVQRVALRVLGQVNVDECKLSVETLKSFNKDRDSEEEQIFRELYMELEEIDRRSLALDLARRSLCEVRQLEDACKHLEGEGGQGRLLHLQSLLRARRRLMVSQIAALYPIVPAPSFVPIGKSLTPNAALLQQRHLANIIPQSSDSSNKDIKSVDKNDSLPMTIGGLHAVAPLNTRPGLYTEPSDHESSATALGYVAHSLALLAACLDVPLRYPIRLGASRSYIQDYAPIVESNEAATNGAGSSSGGLERSLVEFPLFNEGQDSTRSAYAVFLLNKDLEQVLNYMGAESVGPRHTLPNLNKIIKLVCSGACTPA
ncbi:hypothetical protein L7F22_060913 [Adiantum nelumboides]|nr:hypothetical protein [Adiantum nelumboides]